MTTNFPQAWEPPRDLTVDESLWTFKGRTFLKRFMPDKPKKYGFLEYALCTRNGYFLAILVHHLPGKKKRQQRKMNATNMDSDSLLQLNLQRRYGEQGAIVMRLASKLKYDGHHIIGDNAFSSVQLAVDLKIGRCSVKENRIPKCDYTGTQKMLTKKNTAVVHFVEYRNLPTGGWGTIKNTITGGIQTTRGP